MCVIVGFFHTRTTFVKQIYPQTPLPSFLFLPYPDDNPSDDEQPTRDLAQTEVMNGLIFIGKRDVVVTLGVKRDEPPDDDEKREDPI